MSNIEYVNEISIDFDLDTAIMLSQIINSAITISCLPIDPKCYQSIEKLKTLSQFNGLITIKLPNVVLLDTDCLKYKGIKEVKKLRSL